MRIMLLMLGLSGVACTTGCSSPTARSTFQSSVRAASRQAPAHEKLTDAEISKRVVGTWSIGIRGERGGAGIAHHQYSSNGAFKFTASFSENSAGPSVSSTITGTWKVVDGHLIESYEVSQTDRSNFRKFKSTYKVLSVEEKKLHVQSENGQTYAMSRINAQ